MRASLFLFVLLAAAPRLAAQQGAYEAALRSLRAEFQQIALFVANRPMAHLRNAPPGARSDSLMHDPDWLVEMQRQGVVSGFCTPEQFTLGCVPPDSLAERPKATAGFWPLLHTGSDTVRVEVTLSLPPTRPEVAHVEKREYVVARDSAGRWFVVSREITGVS